VIRNVPVAKARMSESKINHGLVSDKMILYQGAVNTGRGLEQAIRSMKYIEKAQLIIAGDGTLKNRLEQLVVKEHLQPKVRFLGRLSILELSRLTPHADVGLSIEEDLGLNYRFALPNKLFDYIQAEVPVIVSNLPEMAAVVAHFQVGLITDSLQPESLAKVIKQALFDESSIIKWQNNLKMAADELIWEKEEKNLKAIFNRFL